MFACAGVVVVAAIDSSAAKSFASQRGSGRIRHVEVKQLWLQQAVAEGRIKLVKVAGPENPADAMTKYHNRDTLAKLLGVVGVEVVGVPPSGELDAISLNSTQSAGTHVGGVPG